jgi:hypothetical protein
MAEHGFVQAAAIDGGLIVKERPRLFNHQSQREMGRKKAPNRRFFFSR